VKRQSSLVSCRERVFGIQKSEYSGRASVSLGVRAESGIGRQAASEDTVRRLGKCCSELQ
jgi:hypothetical protein